MAFLLTLLFETSLGGTRVHKKPEDVSLLTVHGAFSRDRSWRASKFAMRVRAAYSTAFLHGTKTLSKKTLRNQTALLFFSMNDFGKNPHAVALGKLGGSSGGRPSSERKKAACKRNGSLGGRPRKNQETDSGKKPVTKWSEIQEAAAKYRMQDLEHQKSELQTKSNKRIRI